MALTPGLTETLARANVDIYLESERQLIALMAERMSKGLDKPEWAERQLLEQQRYRRQAEQIIESAGAQSRIAVGESVQVAHNRGHAAAVAELGDQLRVPVLDAPGRVAIDTHAVSALAAETTTAVQSTHYGILRQSTDAYRAIIAEAAGPALTGSMTRQQMAQQALNRFASHGITGFVDRAGRNWRIDSYVEMAMRSTLMKAAMQGHTARLVGAGHDLVVVSDHPQECELCRPYEGRVLSLSGAVVGVITRPHELTDAPVVVNVMSSLADAQAAGLFHPGCRHSYSLYMPGVTDADFGETADPQGDKDRQQLRYLERGVRKWKRIEAAALDDEAARLAKGRVRVWQSRIKDHTDTTTAKRIRGRESITQAR